MALCRGEWPKHLHGVGFTYPRATHATETFEFEEVLPKKKKKIKVESKGVADTNRVQGK